MNQHHLEPQWHPEEEEDINDVLDEESDVELDENGLVILTLSERAAMEGDLLTLSRCQDEWTSSTFNMAVQYHHLECTRYLLQHSCPLGGFRDHERYGLFCVFENDILLLQLLLEYNIRMTSSVINEAAANGYDEMVQLLQAADVYLSANCIYTACKGDKPQILHKLLYTYQVLPEPDCVVACGLSGSVECLRMLEMYAQQHHPLLFSSDIYHVIFKLGAHAGKVEFLRYIHEKNLVSHLDQEDACFYCLIPTFAGHFMECTTYVLHAMNVVPTVECMQRCVEYQNYEAFVLLTQLYPELWWDETVKYITATMGYLRMVDHVFTSPRFDKLTSEDQHHLLTLYDCFPHLLNINDRLFRRRLLRLSARDLQSYTGVRGVVSKYKRQCEQLAQVINKSSCMHSDVVQKLVVPFV